MEMKIHIGIKLSADQNKRLSELAKANHRSKQGELLAIVERALK